MYIMKSEILKKESDLKKFKQCVFEAIGVDFPLEYLNQGLIRGFKNKNGKLVGGYALISQAPLRTIESLPGKIKCKYDENQLLEVTALWLDKSLMNGLFSGQFWIQFSKDIYIHSNKSHIIYAYDIESIKLQKLYQLAKPEVIFRGQVKKLAGNSSAAYESIEVATRRRVNFLPLYVLPSFLNKVFFKRTPIISHINLFSYLRGHK